MLNDSAHQYSPDAEGRPVTLDNVTLTFDALGRMVEQVRSGEYTEVVYAPTGEKLALMSGQSLEQAFVPLPGEATAVYTSSGLDHYRHADWLGSARLDSTPARAVSGDVAYAPFGETYAVSGAPDVSFPGQNQDTSTGLYDFLFREYSNQGRWSAPDPAGLGAVSLGNPQTLNRYAYVLNEPSEMVDPLGLDHWHCHWVGNGYHCDVDPGTEFVGIGGGGGGTGSSGPCVLFMAPEMEDPEIALMGDENLEPEPQQRSCQGATGSGGGGNSGGLVGALKYAADRNRCAAKYARSAASDLSLNNKNFFVQSFLGNDAATASQLLLGPDKSDAGLQLAFSNTSVLTARAVGQAFAVDTGRLTVATNAEGTSYATGSILKPVSGTLFGKIAGVATGVLQAGKAVYDVALYFGALVVCSQDPNLK